ncbi:MAG: Type 1 glutamine amidotransferase-like domain-containing protein [Candidatus Micrarchaeales archaeon]|nr:Type 1 glutamine amidotransferase-like domain-containing protein [Candidatus Micrarchaeales archaeon]
MFADAVLKTKSKKLLFIPVAHPEGIFNGVNITHALFHSSMKKSYATYGIDQVDMWADLAGKEYFDLEKYGGIHILGGNTFNLLDKFRVSGFDKLLAKYIEENGAVFGCSAGAIILGKDIGTARFGGDPDKDTTNLKDLSGLGCVGGYSVICHYREVEDEKIVKYVSEKGKAIALVEDSGLHICDDGIKVVGADAIVFENGKRRVLKVGEVLD